MFDEVKLAVSSFSRLFDTLSRVISSKMHGIPCSRNWFAGRRLELVDSWFDDLGNFVWSFPVSPKFAGVQLFSVFEHFTECYIAQLERSRHNLLVVVVLDLMLVVLDLMLVVLDAEQGLVASFFASVQSVEQHVAVKFDVLWHL